MVDISVIICCHNSERRICATLEKVHAAITSSHGLAIEVIVVNNNSSDATEEVAVSLFGRLPDLSFRIVREAQSGLAYARLAGMRAAAGDYFCFIDDDNWPTERYFEVIVSVFRAHSEVGVVGCSTRLPDVIEVPPALRPLLKSYAVGDLYDTSGLVPHGAYVWGAGMAVRGSAMRAVVEGGFQPVLTGRVGALQLAGDDAELSLILCIAGWRAWYECTPLIFHAIDDERFSIDRLKKMHKGFGTSFPVIKRYWRIDKGEDWAASRFYDTVVLARIPVTLLRIAAAYLVMRRTDTPQSKVLLAEKWGRLAFYLARGDFYRRQRHNVLALRGLRAKAGLG